MAKWPSGGVDVFHACNAFETEDGAVVVDVAVHDTMFADSTQGPDSRSSRFERWTIAASTGRVQRSVIDDHPQEFVRCDERRIEPIGMPTPFHWPKKVRPSAPQTI